jgi:hypothetical protein
VVPYLWKLGFDSTDRPAGTQKTRHPRTTRTLLNSINTLVQQGIDQWTLPSGMGYSSNSWKAFAVWPLQGTSIPGVTNSYPRILFWRYRVTHS